MARLMYRGVAHDGGQQRIIRGAQVLIYRGVRHDGLSEQPVHGHGDVKLCYRGHWHRGADNAIAVPSALAGLDGMSVAKEAVAA